MAKFSKCFLLSFFLIKLATAQVPETNQVEDLIQSVMEGVDAEVDFTEEIEQLERYKTKKLDLNKASESQLRQIIFLTEAQIRSFILYRQQYGNLISLYELQAVPTWDVKTIYTVLPYIDINNSSNLLPITFNQMMKDGKHDLMIRTRGVVQEQVGYTDARRNSGSSYYLGNNINKFVRYRYRLDNRISFGITAEKDAGEEFFKGSQKQGFDFYSAHVAYAPDKFLKQIIVGDYQLQFGQGLTMWRGVNFGKSPFVLNVMRQGVGLRAYTSVNENLFFRGTAAQFKYKKFDFYTWISKKKIDGGTESEVDTSGEILDVLGTILESGFHRTQNELDKRLTTDELVYGGRLNYRKKGLQFGATYNSINYGVTLRPDDKPYNLYRAQGNQFSFFGADFSYLYKTILLFGEGSVTSSGGLAGVAGALFAIDPNLSLAIYYRNFQREYANPFALAISESTRNQNEQGFYGGVQYRLSPKITFSAYADRFRSDWLKFAVDAPSYGTDLLADLKYKPNRNTLYFIRYRNRLSQRNISGNTNPFNQLNDQVRQQLRLNATYKAGSVLNLQSRLEFSRFENAQGISTGFLMFQDIQYKGLNSPLTLSTRFALFESETYDARIYAYEADVLYFFSIPAYYGRGFRYYAVAKYRIYKGWDIWLRYASTVFADRTTVGSGLDEINGNVRSDWRIQTRFTF